MEEKGNLNLEFCIFFSKETTKTDLEFWNFVEENMNLGLISNLTQDGKGKQSFVVGLGKELI